jgi:hypothetical protein
MAVMPMPPREAWTDERLDDLNARVDRGFEEMRTEFRAVRSEMADVRAEIGALNRTIHQFLFAVVGTIFLGFMGTIAALFSLAS